MSAFPTISDPGDHDDHAHFNGMCVGEETPICGEIFDYFEEDQRQHQGCDLDDGHDGPHHNQAMGITEGDDQS